MLVETKYKQGDVLAIKLTSGEELLAKLVNEADSLIISKPLLAMATPEGIMVMPWMALATHTENFNINLDKIVCIMKATKDAEKTYLENSSGIKLGV